MAKNKKDKGLYHRWSNKDDSVKVDFVLSNNDEVLEQFEGFPARRLDEFGDPADGVESKKEVYALIGPDYERLTKFGRDMFVNGYEVYVLEVEWGNSSPARWFNRNGTQRLEGILRPDSQSDRENQIGELWNFIEWSILQIPKSGLYKKGQAVNAVMKILIEAYYNGHLDPVTRKFALGNMLNTLRLQRGMKYDYKTLAKSQWMTAKREFMEERGISRDEFEDHRLGRN